ncbi:uncharacterized protein N7483_011506, partial [Penicillium malachiteum]|uniref:uncharacterized protein n=1 Tax=Penicillium malachiteum TaxID=1324776 RepID=UPI0025483846
RPLEFFRLDALATENGTIETKCFSDRARDILPQKVERLWDTRRLLGSSAFGDVVLQQARGTEQMRALKIVVKSRMDRDEAAVDYHKELIALTDLAKHQHQQQEVLVRFIGWFEDPSALYLTTEYFPLGDLSQHMQLTIPENEVEEITTDVLQGLRIMHRLDFAHRDLKPKNIFVAAKPPDSRSWWVKLGDFGISKRARPGETQFHTQVGTPHYEAPEISDPERSTSLYDKSVDIWSLGCVVYQLIFKIVPFQTQGDKDRFYQGQKPFPGVALHGRIGADGMEFVRRLITPRPEERISAERALEMSWLSQKAREPRPQKNESTRRTFMEGTNPRRFVRDQIPAQKVSQRFSPQSMEENTEDCMTLNDHSGSVWRVAFSPDGQLLASASEDKTVRLWHSATGKLHRILRGHLDGIHCIVFSSDGRLAFASGDGTARIWECMDDRASVILEGLERR